METLFEELKQHTIRKINETVLLNDNNYLNLTKGKKYLLVYYDNNHQITMIEYSGTYELTLPRDNYPLGILDGGYYFNGLINNADYSFQIASEFESCRLENSEHKLVFYELNEHFNESIIENMYKCILMNENQNNTNNIGIEIFRSNIHLLVYLTIMKEEIIFEF